MVAWYRPARRRSRGIDDDGSMLVEVVIAAFILSIAVIAVSGSLGSSLGLVGNSRQRSGAVAVAQERLERVHNMPYDRVALYCGCLTNSTPTRSTDSSNPDYALSSDGARYTVDSTHTEPVIFDNANGAIKHIDDPVTVGNTQFNIYQYVTSYDDPNVTGTADYKRVVVVVTWKFPVSSESTNRVSQSTLIGEGVVDVPLATPGPATTQTPAATTAPTPTPAVCPNDSTGPNGNITVLSGAGAVQGYTNSTNVQIVVNATDTCAPISVLMKNGTNENTYTQVTTISSGASSTVTWTIPASAGSNTILVRFGDGAGNLSNVYTGTIIFDNTQPSWPSPANLRASTCTLGGSTRTVSLTWNAASDTNLVGYRVYKSINQATFTLLTATTSQSASDSDSKSYNSVTYRVSAYDKAGNERIGANDLSFSKNNC